MIDQVDILELLKLGNRLGDNASMAMIELVDFNSIYNLNTDSNKKTRRRKKAQNSHLRTVVEEAAGCCS